MPDFARFDCRHGPVPAAARSLPLPLRSPRHEQAVPVREDYGGRAPNAEAVTGDTMDLALRDPTASVRWQ